MRPWALVFAAMLLASCSPSKQKAKTTAPTTSTELKSEDPSPDSQAAQVNAPEMCQTDVANPGAYTPGTIVSIDTPAGFEPAKYFAGFYNAENGTSIMISEVPMALSQLRAVLVDEAALARRGMNKRSSAEQTHSKGSSECRGEMLKVTQSVGNTEVKKSFWLFGDDKRSFQVMGTCFAPCAPEVEQALDDAIKTARYNPNREVPPEEGLPFRLDPSPLSPIPMASRMSYLGMYGDPGSPGSGPAHQSFIFGPVGMPAPERSMSFVKQTLKARAFRDLVILDKEATEFKAAGLEGWKLEATGVARSGELRWIYYVVLFDEPTYWVAIGMCDPDKRDACRKDFDRIMTTVERIE